MEGLEAWSLGYKGFFFVTDFWMTEAFMKYKNARQEALSMAMLKVWQSQWVEDLHVHVEEGL